MLSTRLITGARRPSCSSSSHVCCLSSCVFPCSPVFLMLSSSALHVSAASVMDVACLLSWIKINTNSSWLFPRRSPAVMLERLPPSFCKNCNHSLQNYPIISFCPTLFNVSRSDPRAPELGFRRRDLTKSSAGSGEHRIIRGQKKERLVRG